MSKKTKGPNVLINIGAYRISSDERNISVSYVRIIPPTDDNGDPNVRAGEESLSHVGHYGRLFDALKGIAYHHLMTSEFSSIETLLDRINKLEVRLLAACENLNGKVDDRFLNPKKDSILE